MKTMTICSYYSDVDYADDNFNGVDAVYKILYSDEIDLKKEIQNAFEFMTQENISVIDLSVILNYLKDKRIIFNYSVKKVELFNCDYGNFKE